MRTYFALEPLEKSIFLAGPTPRDDNTPSWRPEALDLLEALKFKGAVYVPESEDWKAHSHYDDQLTWEWEAISISTVVVFWVPRNLELMPAFTTNVEFGLTVASGKCVLGYPSDTPKMKYLAALAHRFQVPICRTLEQTLETAVHMTNKPYSVPPQFDKWE